MSEPQRRRFLKVAGATLVGAAKIVVPFSASRNKQTEALNPTREELIKRLEKLAQSEPPKNLLPGAECYVMAAPVVREKPCPVCKKTMIVGEKDEILREFIVPLRRIQNRGINAKLIIPKHCAGCGDGLEDEFYLEIKYTDKQEPTRVEISPHDLEMMARFLQGKDRYGSGQMGEIALKDEIDRLKELFGVAEKE
jgi:hypothetical protein